MSHQLTAAQPKLLFLFCHFHLFSKPIDILNSRVFSGLHFVYVLNIVREGVYIGKDLMGFINSFRPWVSKLFMAIGHTGYCGLVRGPHVDK